MHRTKAQIEKEFNEFAEKIAKLESLKHELESIDTKGFEAEVKLIRAKLKDIRAIPSITRDIASLRAKVEKKNACALPSTSGLRKRIAHLENLIERKKSGGKQLSKEEIGEVHDIPKLERELSKLKKDFGEHMQGKKVKIDSGVGVLVDAKFDDFVASLKGNLTERLKLEEKELRDKEALELKADLDKRKEMFEEEISELEAERVREMGEEKLIVEEKAAELERKKRELEEKKQKVSMHSKEELAKERENLDKKLSELEKQKRDDLARRKKQFAEKTAEVVKRYHDLYNKKIQENLEREVRKEFNERLREKVSSIKAGVVEETRKKVLANLMRESQKKLGMVTKETSKKLKESTKDTIERLKAKMHNEMVLSVQKEVKEKEKELRKKLEKEYQEKIKSEMKVKEAEMAKKKAQLEAFVALQAKRIFK